MITQQSFIQYKILDKRCLILGLSGFLSKWKFTPCDNSTSEPNYKKTPQKYYMWFLIKFNFKKNLEGQKLG